MYIIKNTLVGNNKIWNTQIKYELCTYHITKKDSTGKSPYELGYGMDITFPIHLKILVHCILQHVCIDSNSLQEQTSQLIKLDKNRRKAYYHIVKS